MNPLPADWTANIALWALTWSLLIAWQVVTVRSDRLPSFGTLVRLAKRTLVTRWLLLAFWAWLGWHLFVRTTY